MFIIIFASTFILNFSENNVITLKNTFDSDKRIEKIIRFRKSKKIDPLLKKAEIKVLMTV